MTGQAQGSQLLYGRIGEAREPVPWPRGPLGAGRLVALRPWHEEGNWEIGWIGASISVTVIPAWGEHGPKTLWQRHWGGRPRTDLVLSEDDVTNHNHVGWEEVPEEIRQIVLGLDTREPEVRGSTNTRPLYPN